jgi:hypothetical protein
MGETCKKQEDYISQNTPPPTVTMVTTVVLREKNMKRGREKGENFKETRRKKTNTREN